MKTREQWLQRAAKALAPRFKAAGYALPAAHVSTGFPHRSSLTAKKRRIGECWDNSVSGDKRAHVFISPVLSNVVDVVATLTHELVHVTVGTAAKHGPVFRKCAVGVGLEGKMTATGANAELAAWITGPLVKKIGAFPHPTFNPRLATRIKDGTRLIKCECPNCGYIVRTTHKWLEMGTPICPCDGETSMVAA